MRVCFTSDLHGDASLYAQLEDWLRAEQPDLLILGGDLVVDIDPEAPARPQVARIHREFVQRVEVWHGLAPRLQVACVPGNHEIAPLAEAWRRDHDAGRLILLDHRYSCSLGGYCWLGYACVPPTPHWAKDFERLDRPGDAAPSGYGLSWDAQQGVLRPVELAEHFHDRPRIAEELATMPAVAAPWVLVAHSPPYDTRLDRLSTSLEPFGSRAIRRLIEEGVPHLSLHGHVHESPRVSGTCVDRIGPTVCVNPGQSHTQLHGVAFELDRPAETMSHTVRR